MRYLPLFAAIYAVVPFAVDMYLPALLLISESLNSNILVIQNSISIFLAGYAVGMFIFGPQADKFGRRPLLILGLTGFVVFSAWLSVAQTAEEFIALRFFQALFGGAATVVIPGAIRMLFGEHTAKGLAYVSMIMMIAPMIAPALGGYLLLFDTWPLIFEIITLYAFLILILAIFLFPNLEAPPVVDETGPIENLNFIRRYKIVLSRKQCRPFLVVSTMTSLAFFTYITSVSFLYIEVFEFDEQTFSFIFALNVISMMSASWLNTRIVPRFGSRKILNVVIPIGLVASIVMFGIHASEVSAGYVIASIIFTISCLMLISSNSDALTLQAFSAHTGTATAVIGTLRFGFGALAGPILAWTMDPRGIAVTIVFMLCLLIIASAVWLEGKQCEGSKQVHS